SGCFPLRVQFTDLSNAGAGNTDVSWNWDLGNGTTSTQQDPFVTYTTAGVYSVTLKVTNDKGCVKTITIPNYINVTPGVIAAFNNTQPTVCQPPANIFFTNTSSGPGTLTYVWDFGDGNTSTITNPSDTYANTGAYTVTLVATSSSGCTDTLRRTNAITIGGITTSFTAPDSICVNEPINFINTSSPSPATSNWSFGDATISTQINPVKSYTTPGLYTIRLINTYANCQDSALKSIKILAKPVANFSAPVTKKCEPSLTVNFQDLSINASSWLWNFGDGNTSTAQNPSHTYNNYGSYNVSLIITNASGCSETIQKNQFVKIARAVITIPSLPMKGCIPFVITPIPGITALDAVTSYTWDFGDGGSSTLPNPSHTYSVQGTYTVKLVITTSSGCTDSLIIPAAVTVGSKPTADFSATPNPVCAFQPVQFTDLSTPANQWQWQFGDGGSSAIQNPSYTYTDTGSFSVTLIVTNNGCPDTAIKTNYVTVLPPIARFAATTNCASRLQFTFSDQSIGATGWQWDFGDGNTSTAQNPVHSFPGLGSFNVTLTVTNGTCSHSVTHTINTIQQSPDFFASATTICRGISLGFQSTNL
ncbi:MAG: PKD domain-containing protein, partial [Bacteroidetes bacterium]|nr:PKD domain-containing protein [Bacteroidota bacterium]